VGTAPKKLDESGRIIFDVSLPEAVFVICAEEVNSNCRVFSSGLLLAGLIFSFILHPQMTVAGFTQIESNREEAV
jgi:hypothetical protein